MVDIDKSILNNPTLGAAAHGTFLDVKEVQDTEDRNAAIEGREPRKAVRTKTYPELPPSGAVNSDRAMVVFEGDENGHDGEDQPTPGNPSPNDPENPEPETDEPIPPTGDPDGSVGSNVVYTSDSNDEDTR